MIIFTLASPRFPVFLALTAAVFPVNSLPAQTPGKGEATAPSVPRPAPLMTPPRIVKPPPPAAPPLSSRYGTPEYDAYVKKREEERKRRTELAERKKAAKEAAFQFTPSPPMWKMTDADSTIYIFGAETRLPYQLNWQSEAFKGALKSANNIYLDTPYFERSDRDKRLKNDREAFRKIIRHDRDNIEDRMDPGLFEAIRSDLKNDFISFGDFLPTWFLVSHMADMDKMFQPGRKSNSIDNQIIREITKRNIEIKGLEHPTHMLDQLNSISEKQQRKWLNDFVRSEAIIDRSNRYEARNREEYDPDAILTQREEKAIAWARGKTQDQEVKLPAGLSDLLHYIRNDRMKKWPEKIAEIMNLPGTTLIVVNQEYLFGENNLRNGLETKGYTLERVN